MSDMRTAARQALEVLEYKGNIWHMDCPLEAAITALKAALELPYAEQARRVEQETHGRMRIDPVTGDVSIGTPTEQEQEQEQEQEPVAFDALVAISLLTHLGGEVAEYADVVEAVRRLHTLNGELLEALQRSRAQWIHSVNAEFCLAVIARAEE